MNESPWDIVREAVLIAADITIEDIQKNLVVWKRVLKDLNKRVDSRIEDIRDQEKPSDKEIYNACLSEEFIEALQAEDKEVIDKKKECYMTKTGFLVKLFKYPDNSWKQDFYPKTKDYLAVLASYIGWQELEDDRIVNYRKRKELGADKEHPLSKFQIENEEILDRQKGQSRENFNISKFIKTYPEIERRSLSGFVGRKFVFDKINNFVGLNDRGYFRIIGDPGIGKTTLATKYAKDNNCFLHIVNAGKDGTGTAKKFLQNICAQIVIQRGLLEFENLPDDIDKDSSFIEKVLRSASENIKNDGKIIIVVDGLDEVVDLTFYRNKNILLLPRFLPPNIYFILTMRKIEDQIQLPNEEKNGRFEISNESKENLADTEEYIRNEIEQEGIQRYLHEQAVEKEELIETLIEKSDGNFMYLKYVIPEIAMGDYKDATLSTLPRGLEGYYRDHWNRMMAVPEEVKNIKLKTIYVLSEMNNPVSTTFLSDIVKSNIEGVEAVQIQKILNEWMQFLHIRKGQEGEQKYSFYHKSFLDFLRSNEMIKAAGFDLADVNEIIADYMTKGLFE